MTPREQLLRAVLDERWPPAAIEREAWEIRVDDDAARVPSGRDTDLATAARRRVLRTIPVTHRDVGLRAS